MASAIPPTHTAPRKLESFFGMLDAHARSRKRSLAAQKWFAARFKGWTPEWGNDEIYALVARHCHVTPKDFDAMTHALQLALIERAIEASGAQPKRRVVKRRQTKTRPLTSQQLIACDLFGTHKGNLSAVAKAMGKSRKTVRQHINAAYKKLGRVAPKFVTPKTQDLPHDKRGQVIREPRFSRPRPSDEDDE